MHWHVMDQWLQQLTPFASFLSLTPLNLVSTAIILFFFHTDWNRAFVVFAFLAFGVGFGVEVAGVHTGLIFGEYEYGEVLGFKVWEVPLLIGVNWLVLAYAAGVLAEKITSNTMGRVVLIAATMTALDWLIEPVAIQLQFWTWNAGEIPPQNFVAWFLIAALLGWAFQKLSFRKENRMAVWVLGVQAVFFALQQFLLNL